MDQESLAGLLCENCMTEWCAVVHSTADAMGVPPVSINKFRYLQTKWRTPKAGVTGSIRGKRSEPKDAEGEAAQLPVNPVGRAK